MSPTVSVIDSSPVGMVPPQMGEEIEYQVHEYVDTRLRRNVGRNGHNFRKNGVTRFFS